MGIPVLVRRHLYIETPQAAEQYWFTRKHKLRYFVQDSVHMKYKYCASFLNLQAQDKYK